MRCIACARPIREPIQFATELDADFYNCMSCGGWDRTSAADRRDFYQASWAFGERINPYVQYTKP